MILSDKVVWVRNKMLVFCNVWMVAECWRPPPRFRWLRVVIPIHCELDVNATTGTSSTWSVNNRRRIWKTSCTRLMTQNESNVRQTQMTSISTKGTRCAKWISLPFEWHPDMLHWKLVIGYQICMQHLVLQRLKLHWWWRLRYSKPGRKEKWTSKSDKTAAPSRPALGGFP